MSRDQMIEEVGLLPCPFCGGEAVDTSHTSCDCCGKAFTGEVSCKACGASIAHFDTAGEAVAAWNTRPLASQILALKDKE